MFLQLNFEQEGRGEHIYSLDLTKKYVQDQKIHNTTTGDYIMFVIYQV